MRPPVLPYARPLPLPLSLPPTSPPRRPLTWRRRLLRALVYVTAGFVLAVWLLKRPKAPPPALTVEQVQMLSQLVTTRIQVADVRTTEIKGFTGGSQAAIMLKGDVLLSVDLTRARFEAMNPEAKTAVLVLPEPQVLSPRIDHAQTRIYALADYGLWKIVPSDMGKTAALGRAYKEGQQAIEAAGGEESLVKKAKEHAEKTIECFFEAMGWKVTVKWEER